MNADRLGRWALVGSILLVGGTAWWLQTRPALVVDVSPLATLPRTIGDWRSADVPLDSAVESVLRADANVQRAYSSEAEGPIDPVWVYIGYYGTERGGRPEHVPRWCYTAAGWDIVSARVLRDEDGSERRMNEYLVARHGERQLVHYWYRSARRTGMVGGMDQRVDQIVGRLEGGRSDGALVRVSTTLDAQGESAARARLLAFGGELDRQIAHHWPVERSR